ncbi:MAG: hypothetical protein ABSC05_32240 [Candidatus Solibacter sp.]|jgi:hypothetical protein
MTMFLEAFAGSLLAMIVVGVFLKSELRLCLTEMALSMKSDIQSYVNEQSKTLATKDDIRALVVEGAAHLNANLVATISDRRSTWAAKKEIYERAMQYVAAARSKVQCLMIAVVFKNLDVDAQVREVMTQFAKYNGARSEIMNVLPLYAPDAVVQAYFDVMNAEEEAVSVIISGGDTDQHIETSQAHLRASDKFVRAARADLAGSAVVQGEPCPS